MSMMIAPDKSKVDALKRREAATAKAAAPGAPASAASAALDGQTNAAVADQSSGADRSADTREPAELHSH